MSISLSCPECGQKLNAPDKAAGKRLKCPKCGKPVSVAPRIAPPKQSASSPPIPSEQRDEDLAAAFLSEGHDVAPSPLPSYSDSESSTADNTPAQAPTSWLSRPDFQQPAEKATPLSAPKPRRMLLWGGIALALLLLSAGAIVIYRIHAANDTQKHATQDPVQQFKAIVDAKVKHPFLSFVEKSDAYDVPSIDGKTARVPACDRHYTVTFSDFSFDVKKTDSLVSPYEGQISCEFRQLVESKYHPSSEGFRDKVESDHRYRLIAYYAYQDNRWVFKGSRSAFEDGDFGKLYPPSDGSNFTRFFRVER